MGWLAIQMEVGALEAERWSDALLAQGAISIDLADAKAGTGEEEALFDEPGEQAGHAWSYTRLTALFADAVPVAPIMAELARELGTEPDYRLLSIAEQDWVQATQRQFDPISVSARLWIVPSWCEVPHPDAVNIVLDPGLAFGTGSHPTTRLCLQWLEANVRGGERVLDYGCGSGILAIAAAKLGATSVVGVDIDAQAIAASRINARRNQVVATFQDADEPLGFTADLLAANILANPLRLLAPMLAAHVVSGGRIVLSGILADQADAVLAAYRPSFALSVWRQEEGWVALAGERR